MCGTDDWRTVDRGPAEGRDRRDQLAAQPGAITRLRPDLRIMSFRGNIDMRLAKPAAGEADGTLLAAAGLDRLDAPMSA
jgi:hypothetical protein